MKQEKGSGVQSLNTLWSHQNPNLLMLLFKLWKGSYWHQSNREVKREGGGEEEILLNDVMGNLLQGSLYGDLITPTQFASTPLLHSMYNIPSISFSLLCKYLICRYDNLWKWYSTPRFYLFFQSSGIMKIRINSVMYWRNTCVNCCLVNIVYSSFLNKFICWQLLLNRI